MRTTGCPARSSCSSEASVAASGAEVERSCTKTRSRPYTSGGPLLHPSIGMMPLPCLPSDSATSCSSQTPNWQAPPAQSASACRSPPARASPSSDAELESGIVGAVGRAPLAIVPRPIEQHAGVDADERGRNQTEVRQRGVPAAHARNACERSRRNFSWRAIGSSFEPGSVVTTKRRPAFRLAELLDRAVKKYCLRMFTSSVVPDFDATRNSACGRVDRALDR